MKLASLRARRFPWWSPKRGLLGRPKGRETTFLYDVLLLAGLCLAMLVYGAGNISLRPARQDGRQNLAAGIMLAQDARYGSHYREPFVPFLIAAIDLARRTLGYEPVPRDCVSEHSDMAPAAPGCPPKYAPYKVLNILFLLLAAVGVFVLVRWFTGTRLLAYAGFLLTVQSAPLLASADRFYTEMPAAALLTATCVLFLLTLTRRRPVYSALLGLTFAALLLTKVIFAYLWIFIALALVVPDLSKGRITRSTLALVGVFILVFSIPVFAWMARNHATSGDFALTPDLRRGMVWNLRASYNGMRDDEYAAGFWYYLSMTSRDLVKRGIPRESFERFARGNDAGFRRTAQKYNVRRLKELRGAESMADAKARMIADAKARMIADPWQHLKVSLLLAWRGVFVGHGLGYVRPRAEHFLEPVQPLRAPRIADSWGFEAWPRWKKSYSPAASSIVDLTGFLALIVAPLWFWFSHGRFEVVLVALPALYAHGVYALVSHFIPRYAVPETPLRIVAVMLLVFLLASSMRRLGRKLVVFLNKRGAVVSEHTRSIGCFYT